MKRALYLLLLGLILNSCYKLFEESEGQTFQITGQLFQGHSDSPYAHKELILNGYWTPYTSFNVDEQFDLDKTETDKNGYFSLVYDQKLSKTEAKRGKLELNFPPYELDWNRNIALGRIAETPHKRIQMTILKTQEIKDTLFISAGRILESDYHMRLPLLEDFNDVMRDVIAIPPELINETSLFELYFIAQGQGGKDWSFRYAIGRSEIIKTILENANRVSAPVRGFPFTDEVELQIP